jgi:hypothetical protein
MFAPTTAAVSRCFCDRALQFPLRVKDVRDCMCPWFGAQVKYRTPPTSPSLFPIGSSKMMPTWGLSEKWTRPTKAIEPTTPSEATITRSSIWPRGFSMKLFILSNARVRIGMRRPDMFPVWKYATPFTVPLQ